MRRAQVDDGPPGDLITMKDLHLPPPHTPRRREPLRSKAEHDTAEEQHTPRDAPDVENRHLIEQMVRVPTHQHCPGP